MSTALKSSSAQWPVGALTGSPVLPESLLPFAVGEYIFGTDQATSVFNYVDPAAPLTVQGVPTYNANSVVVRSSASAGYGFKSGIVPDLEFSLILVRKPAATASVPLIAGFSAPSGDPMFGPYQFGGNTYMGGGETLYTNAPSRATPAGATIFAEMISVAKDVRTVGRYSAGGALVKVTAPADRAIVERMANDNATQYYRQVVFGSNDLSDSINTNTVEIYYGAIINKALTDQEADEIYASLVSFYAARGVTIA